MLADARDFVEDRLTDTVWNINVIWDRANICWDWIYNWRRMTKNDIILYKNWCYSVLNLCNKFINQTPKPNLTLDGSACARTNIDIAAWKVLHVFYNVTTLLFEYVLIWHDVINKSYWIHHTVDRCIHKSYAKRMGLLFLSINLGQHTALGPHEEQFLDITKQWFFFCESNQMWWIWNMLQLHYLWFRYGWQIWQWWY